MRFGSLCSGIEGAAVAWPEWSHSYCAEIDPFCSRLLARHYPDVPNFGDITAPRDWPSVDVLVAGTPCQSFSVQGKRKGLADERGQVAIAFANILKESQPQAFIWENVPGVLGSNGGRDFATFLHAVSKCGYGIGWRVLNLCGFGIPQRRRRLFVVGILNDARRAAEILFESEPNQSANGTARKERQARPKILGWSGDETPKFGAEIMPTLRASQGGEGAGILWKDGIRKLTINEYERLMGFPVDYTRGFGPVSQRRKALGNAFPPPVLAWIGKRLESVIQPSQPVTRSPQTPILTLQRISSSLAALNTVDDAKALRDKAEALRVYYQKQVNCRDIERQATVVRLRAERRIGELLATTVKRGSKSNPGEHIPNGITRKQSSNWQALAKVPESKFEAYLERPGSISTKGLAALVKRPKRRPVEIETLIESTILRLRNQVAAQLGCDPFDDEVTKAIATVVKRRGLTVVA